MDRYSKNQHAVNQRSSIDGLVASGKHVLLIVQWQFNINALIKKKPKYCHCSMACFKPHKMCKLFFISKQPHLCF